MIATAVQLAVSSAGVDDAVNRALYIASLTVLATVPFAFLFGLLRSRLTRAGAVGSLIARLGEGRERRGSLRDALADALGDPTLELAYWLPDRERYVDATGQPFELPGPGSGRAWTAVARDGEPLAAIVHDASLVEERELIDTAGAAAALTLENERLDAELRARVEELSHSRERLVEVGTGGAPRPRAQPPRRRAAAARGARAEPPARAREDRGRPRGRERAARRGDGGAARGDLAELRELARGIHPAVLTDRGLPAALEALAGRAPVAGRA